MKKSNIWEPVYKISPKIARALMDIEAAKTIVERTALPPVAEAELRRAARVRSAHFSTQPGTYLHSEGIKCLTVRRDGFPPYMEKNNHDRI